MKNGNNHSPSILEFLGEVNKLIKETPGQLCLKGQLWLCNTSFLLLPLSFLLSPSLPPINPKTITELLSHSHLVNAWESNAKVSALKEPPVQSGAHTSQ